MSRQRKLPLVAICGRPNVGKSTLFNRLSGRQRAIIHKEEGITRDRAHAPARHGDHAFTLVDTGGIVEDPRDAITHKMQEQVRVALKEAAVILFVLDGQQEITRVDEEIRDELFRLGKPVVLVINKMDNHKLTLNATDFYSLGMGDPVPISSGHGIGIEDLMNIVVQHLPPPPAGEEAGADNPPGEDEEEEDDGRPGPRKRPDDGVTRVAVIGKPNVGKSSFINAILNEERTIVTDVAGTTRDAIDIEFHWKGNDYLFIDTAGMRKKAGIREDVERFSVSRSLRSIRRADVCMVMMDATEGLTEQDKRITDYIAEQGAAMILVWTKWDLVEDKARRFKEIGEELDFKAPFLKYVPYVTVSNLTRQRLFEVFEYIDKVAAMARFRVGTGELNRFVETLRANDLPAAHKGNTAKVLYATQTGVQPTVFTLFVNQTRLFHFSYIRHIENKLRERFGFDGVPIKIELRAESKNKRGRQRHIEHEARTSRGGRER
jgi:GTPase